MGSVPDSWKREPGPVCAKRNMARESVIPNRRFAKQAEIIWTARSRFLACAVSVDPAVFWSLFPTRDECGCMSDAWLTLPQGWSEAKADALQAWHESRGTSYGEFMRAWQARFRLPDEWCWQAATETILQQWPLCPPPNVDGVPVLGLMQTPNVQPVPYMSTIRPEDHTTMQWIPEYETRTQVEQRIQAAVAKELDRIEAKHDFVPVPQKSLWHFLWLAMHVVGRQSTYEIALNWWPELRPWQKGREHLHKARTIDNGVTSCARMIGLTLP